MTRTAVMDWLLERVRQEGSCLIWTCALNNQGLPVASVDGVRARNVRRWLFEELEGDLNPGMKLVPTCRNGRCLSMKHCAELLPAQLSELLGIEGRLSTPARRAACRRVSRAASPNSMEQAKHARSLRAAGAKLREISAATGLTISNASKICTGKAWVDTAPGASVFTWSGAA
jgi:hypothetical protein